MSEYAPGHTIGSAATLDKERIVHALKGELMVGEDEQGFIYEPASREECEKYILDAFDNMVYQCLELAASGRVLERILTEKGYMTPDYFKEYVQYKMEETAKSDYVYEFEVREFLEDMEEL